MNGAPAAETGREHVFEAGLELVEVPAPVRVHRSRLAFAISVTVASLPILVLDNFPATADTGERSAVEAAAVSAAAFDRPTITVTVESERGPVDPGVAQEAPSTTAGAAPVAVAAQPVEATDADTSADTEISDSDSDSDDEAQAGEPQPAESVRSAPAPAPTTTTTAAPAPSRQAPANGDPNDPATWDRLAQCESHGNWSLNSGNGYYGGLQFSLATWRDVGGSGYPHEASREEQIKRGQMLQARYGWGQWPHCSSELGYR